MAEKVKVLSQIELFTVLNPKELKELAELFEWRTYSNGACLIGEGQVNQNFFVLVTGSAKILYGKKGLDPLPVHVFGPGDTFGEISLLDGNPSTTPIYCTEDCRLLVTDSEGFAQILARWPKLYEYLIIKLSHRYTQANVGLMEARHKDFLRTGLAINQFKYKFYDIWGAFKTTWEVEHSLDTLSKSKEHVLLIGERGTGQQMMAWHLHRRQFGEKAPFIVLSARQFDQLLTLETLGNDLLDIAEGGTLFIRDVNLISPGSQLKLVTALQNPDMNCRLIGTLISNPELLTVKLIPQLEEYFTLEYKFTPLRDRKKDIPVIAQAVLEKLAERNNRDVPTLDREAVKLLLTHNYRQANVTELIQIIERAFFLTEETAIRPEHLFFGPTAEKTARSFNLLSIPKFLEMIQRGWFPLWVKRVFAFIFILGLFALFFQPNTADAALGLLLAWNIWWPALAILSSLLGRIWCGVCPFSYFMELAQKLKHYDKPVPDIIKKYDYLFITFLFCFIFWLEMMIGMRYNALHTGLLVLGILLIVIAVGVIFTRHTWCRHLCPLGGFISMSAIGGILEIRANPEICLNKCTTHECFRGTKEVAGCPMSQHTAFLDNNQACKFCLNCVRNCPNNSVQVNLRVPAREVWHLVRINQGFAVFVGVTLGILFPIIYFEPLYHLWPKVTWQLWFTLFFWGSAFASGLITWFLARPFKTKAASRQVKLAFAIVPFVVSGYIAYHLNFVPGLNAIFVTMGYSASSIKAPLINLSALSISQIAAASIGLLLTSFAISMVIIRTKRSRK